jgi:hypothetical protein
MVSRAMPHMLFPYDMYHFWAAGLVARTGGNPYAVSEIQRVMSAAGWPPEEAVLAMYSRRDDLVRAMSLYLPLSLLATSYTWTHGFLALLPAHMALVSRIHASWPRAVQYALFVLAVVSSIELCMPLMLSQYMVFVPIGLFISGLYQKDCVAS